MYFKKKAYLCTRYYSYITLKIEYGNKARHTLNRIIARKGNGMIKVITGIRRCGKSYLLFTLFTNYLKSQGVDEQHIIKVDLEDRRNAFLRNPDALLKHIVCLEHQVWIIILIIYYYSLLARLKAEAFA